MCPIWMSSPVMRILPCGGRTGISGESDRNVRNLGPIGNENCEIQSRGHT